MSGRSGIDRRNFLIILGASIVASCADQDRTKDASETAVPVIDSVTGLALASAIIPGFDEEDQRFLEAVLSKSVPEPDLRVCASGLSALDDACNETFGAPFARLEPNIRRQVAAWLDMDVNSPPKADDLAERAATCRFFELFKSIALLSHFTSGRASASLVTYDPVPGDFSAHSGAGQEFAVDIYDRGSVYFFPPARWRLG